MKKIPPHIEQLKGKKPGPCVLIIGSIHGNERIGEAVISKLSHDIKPENIFGELILILGNPEAYTSDKRFIDFDLNRLFNSAQIAALKKRPATSLNREEKRALEIEPYLKKADYLLDIHSTIKPSVPFIYCDKIQGHFELAQLFETEYIVSTLPNFEISGLNSCTDNYVNNHGGIGITYETGWHKTATLSPEIMDKIYQFLQAVGSLESTNKLKSSTNSSTEISIYDQLIPKTSHFHFKKDFVNFDVVEKGEIIAQDDKKNLKATKKSFIIFPKVDIVVGKPACYLGTKTN